MPDVAPIHFSKSGGVITVAIILLDYAALDDITTGNQPSFVLEYLFLLFSAIWFAATAIRRSFL